MSMQDIERLGHKVTNGGVSDDGKLKSAEWNKFISDLISELNKRIVSVILNGVSHEPTNGAVDLGQIQIDVDAALSETSTNPVRNSVITREIQSLITNLNDKVSSVLLNGMLHESTNGIVDLGSIISAVSYELSVNSEGQLIITYASSSNDFTMEVNNDGELLITY